MLELVVTVRGLGKVVASLSDGAFSILIAGHGHGKNNIRKYLEGEVALPRATKIFE